MRTLFALLISSLLLFGDVPLAPGTSSYVNTSTIADEFEKEFNPTRDEEGSDPLKGYNEVMTSVNDTFYVYVMRPIALGYSAIVPEGLRIGIANAVDNLFFPVRLINTLLQGKFAYALEESERFVINSTLGFAGFVDIAKEEFKLQAHNEDFGQTLGFYGVGKGFHVVLPLLGPSNVRDMVGTYADSWANPLNYIEARDLNLLNNEEEELYVTVSNVINKTSLHVKDMDALRKDAIELYPLLRNVYETRRDKLIRE